MFEAIRTHLGEEIELLHDVHERIPPIMAIQLAKDLEPYRLFFLEDVFAPEDQEYFRLLRPQTSTPLAMGELYVSQAEYLPLIKDRLIDFIRVHISDIGGITPARKLAVFSELFGVRTAWHGPGDVSPVGHAANLHLDLASSNFGIQEAYLFPARTREVFPGCPEIHDGAMWTNDRPGLGIDVDEALAARYPFPEHPYNGAWPEIRRADGTVIRP
jgi:mannonate dehydratase